MDTQLIDHLQHLFATSHNTTEWFVAFQKAVKGLSHEQATQKLTPEGDTIFGLVAHLTFWNERYLNKMKGIPQSSPIPENNELTFTSDQFKTWDELLKKAEDVFSGWSRRLEGLNDKDAEHFGAIANTSMHNAYHIGQIVILRKLQGSWNKEEGVK